MKVMLRYLFVLLLLLAFGYGLYLLGQSAAIRTALFPGSRFPAFEGRHPPQGFFEGQRPPRDFDGRLRGEFGGFEEREFERFERDGGFNSFGLLRLAGTLLQVTVIVALVVGLERLFGRAANSLRRRKVA